MSKKQSKSRAKNSSFLEPDPQPSEHTPQKPAAPRVSLHNFSSASRFDDETAPESFDPMAGGWSR